MRTCADLVRQVAEQLGWKPMGSLGPADLASLPGKSARPVTRRAADRVVTRPPVTEPTPLPVAEPLFSADSGHFRVLVDAGKPA